MYPTYNTRFITLIYPDGVDCKDKWILYLIILQPSVVEHQREMIVVGAKQRVFVSMTLNSVESANLDPVLRTAFSFLSIREELVGIEAGR